MPEENINLFMAVKTGQSAGNDPLNIQNDDFWYA
jgi:hypothetical protein